MQSFALSVLKHKEVALEEALLHSCHHVPWSPCLPQLREITFISFIRFFWNLLEFSLSKYQQVGRLSPGDFSMTVCRLCQHSFFKNAPIVWLYHLNDGYLGEAGIFKKVKIKFLFCFVLFFVELNFVDENKKNYLTVLEGRSPKMNLTGIKSWCQ